MHGRAFEVGLFILTTDLRIAVNTNGTAHEEWSVEKLKPHDGKPILQGMVAPSFGALQLHWNRIEFEPVAKT